MNILIADSWLREHLKTKATAQEIAKYLSLCGQSVESLTKKGNDWLYDIEITTNRPDCLSVYGIARELAAILPRFEIAARLKEMPETKRDIPVVKKSLPFEITLTNPSLCPRFTSLIFDQITIKPSPQVIQDRLEKSGIRALNNVVDISNYLMLELGQPMHTFDYDKILEAKMILREAKEGEKVVTLDSQSRTMPEGAMVIEDGQRRLIDLCGIMGGANSEVDENTTRVLLFIQTYDPVRIRQTCQALNFRTEAASRFEKGIEPEGVMPAMKKAMVMFEENCGARVASQLTDIYPHPLKPKKVSLSQEKLDLIMGLKIPLSEAKEILESLGFATKVKGSILESVVPYWRHGDIALPEDLIEEIARIYGYHRLPTVLPTGAIPQETKVWPFAWEEKAKDLLKDWGLTEVVTYSLVSQEEIAKIGYQPKNYLQLANPLFQELTYLKPSLIPSLLQVVAKNQAQREKISIFEMANIYLPRKEELPDERMILAVALTGPVFSQAKGMLEVLLDEMGIEGVQYEPYTNSQIWHPGRTAIVKAQNRRFGLIGEIQPQVLKSFGVKGRVVVFNLGFDDLAELATQEKHYHPIPKYPAIIEDLAFVIPAQTLVGEMIEAIKKVSQLIARVELLDSYQNTRTFRITYQSPKKTLSDREVEKIRKKVIENVRKGFKAQLKR